MEKVLDDLSFEAPDRSGDTVTIDADDVREQLRAIVEDEDVSRFIL
jgi:ATP-dependent HslUV protease ATP-binding subunit HslU